MTAARARKQATAEYRFFAHLAVFAFSAPVLLGLALVLAPESSWTAWAVAAWANVVLVHGVVAFGHVLRKDWVRRRAASLHGALTEDEVLLLIDQTLRARPLSDAAAYTLGQFRHRLDRIEGVRPGGDSIPPPYALGTLPSGPFRDDDVQDLLGADRSPIDTPRLDESAG